MSGCRGDGVGETGYGSEHELVDCRRLHLLACGFGSSVEDKLGCSLTADEKQSEWPCGAMRAAEQTICGKAGGSWEIIRPHRRVHSLSSSHSMCRVRSVKLDDAVQHRPSPSLVSTL